MLAGEGSAFHRVMRPQGLCLPIISMAVRLRLEDDVISTVTISMGPVGPVPHIAEAAMASLLGGPATPQHFVRATEIALANVTLRGSKYRATTEYRAQMIRTYLPLILTRAAERAIESHTWAAGVLS
jgi:CO/xanthine dehydrogenase FAD-binding subunit